MNIIVIMEVAIDLRACTAKEQVLSKIGEALELGGPDGNHKVEAVNQGSGWGMNWDALIDSLHYLDSGGIWGTSRKFTFPLLIKFRNHEEFQAAHPKDFSVLQEVLEIVRKHYMENGKKFHATFSNSSALD